MTPPAMSPAVQAAAAQAAAAPLPDLTLLTTAASALPRSAVDLASTLAGLPAAQAALKGIAAELSALQSITDLLKSTADVARELKGKDLEKVLRKAAREVQDAVSPAAEAAQRLDDSLSRLLPALRPLGDEASAAASRAGLLLQAPGALRTLYVLSAVAAQAPTSPIPARSGM